MKVSTVDFLGAEQPLRTCEYQASETVTRDVARRVELVNEREERGEIVHIEGSLAARDAVERFGTQGGKYRWVRWRGGDGLEERGYVVGEEGVQSSRGAGPFNGVVEGAEEGAFDDAVVD